MKILYITKESMTFNEAPPSRILNTKRALEKFHEVFVICRKNHVHEDNVFEMPVKGRGFVTNQIYKIVMLFYTMYFILSRKIDFIIVREYYYIFMLYLFTRFTKTKIIYDMHCFRYKELWVENKYVKSYLIRYLEKLSHRLTDFVAVIGEGIRKDLNKSMLKKAFDLPNGVNLDDYNNGKSKGIRKKYNIPKNKKIIGFVGNWMEWVDIDTILRSSKYLDDDIVLLVIGSGYLKPKKKGVRGNVIMPGRIDHDDVIALLKEMDLCALSYFEKDVIRHLSIRKTFEYLAAGKPIIMSDSEINEKKFLKENINYVKFKPGDEKDFAVVANKLLKDKKKIEFLAKNNLQVSKNYSWNSIITNSDLLKIIKTYELDNKPIKGKISIIIKALNEEQHIEESIKSALKALNGLKGEVILVDSISSDRTVEIAKKYPIKIIQLNDMKDKRCGIGPDVGYLNSTGEFLYMLDGDMVLDKDFIRTALPYFGNERVVGIGGNIVEKSHDNLAFQVRTKHHVVKKTQQVQQLGMGGLYRRTAIDKVGYFSNPYLYAYEEYDIASKLSKLGKKLLRIPYDMVEHYGDETTSLSTLIGRWKSKYLFGSGQYLRRGLHDHHFFRTFNELIIYILTLIWFLFGVGSVLLIYLTLRPLEIYGIVTLFFLVVMLIRKKSWYRVIFSLFSWNFQALGMMIGFFIGTKNPKKFKQNVKIIKK